MNLFSAYFELFQGKLLKGQNLLVALGMMKVPS